MTGVVVEVGPVTVRGPNHADCEWVSAGIDAIDDELALVDERALSVPEVWRTVMRDVVGGSADAITVVCPTWWPSSRVDRIRDAALSVTNDVSVLRRAQLHSDGATLVEIAQDFVVVSAPGDAMHVVARGDTEALVAKIPDSTAVLLDCPEGVTRAGALASAIADHLRANGVAVTIADRDWVRRTVEGLWSSEEQRPVSESVPSAQLGRRARAVLTGAVLSAAVLCGGFVARQDAQPPTAGLPMTLLVERRLGIMVPAEWAVQRVTTGPGSARVQFVSPDDSGVALHVTQSSLPPQSSLERVAESVRTALDEEPDGVFVDFKPFDRRADRPVVSYRELRADRHIVWIVLIDRSVRIAIGCQSPPGHEDAVREVCDRAIRTAHAVF